MDHNKIIPSLLFTTDDGNILKVIDYYRKIVIEEYLK